MVAGWTFMAMWRKLALTLLLCTPLACLAKPTEVLVIYSQNRFHPANAEVDQGLNPPLDDLADVGKLRFFAEFLDDPDFSGEEHDKRAAQYLREKYEKRQPKVVIAGGYIALRFLLRYGNLMFPGVPMIHMGVDQDFLEATPGLPADLKGVPVDYDVPGTIQLALHLLTCPLPPCHS